MYLKFVKFFMIAISIILSGCSSSPPKLPEPKGDLTPVYPLQSELNQRHHFNNDEMRITEKLYDEMVESLKRSKQKSVAEAKSENKSKEAN